MSTAWDQAKKLAEQHAGAGSLFVRLQNDGDKVVGVFCGDPYAREVYWTGETYSEVPPAGASGRPTLRILLNFFVPAEGAMKIVEGGTAWFRDVVGVRDKYVLDKWTFEVKRYGKKGDPKTRYSILPDAHIDDGVRARIAASPLHDLSNLGAGAGAGAEAEGGADADDDAMADTQRQPQTIDMDTARAVLDRLRPLPREVATALLAEFKVTRLRELLWMDLPRVMRFLETHERQAAAVPFDL
jgi:hypothetical protein